MSRRLVRKLRNISSTQTEIKIKGATSNDAFGPTTQELNDIALLTGVQKDLKQITTVLTHRLNDQARNWRHILKCLTVIQYCLLAGSTEFVSWMKHNGYLITTLREFQMKHNDEAAHQIRQKSRSITKLLKNDTLLEEKRSNYHIFRSNMARPSIDKRSSLDIQRGDIDVEESIILPDNFEPRRGKSMEITRSSGNQRDFSPARQEMFKMLDNIMEE